VNSVRIACCQIAPVVGDLEGNTRLTRAAVHAAVGRGARLVVLPELATSGYVFESVEETRACAEPATGRALAGWAEEAARGAAVVVGGFCEAGDDGLLYNSAAVVDGRGVQAVYRKIHLWDREQLFFAPGVESAAVVETAVGRIGVAVCYDLNFPEVARGLAVAGADVVAVPTNWPSFPRPEGERPIEIALAMATAHVNHVFVAACDRTGTERGVEWTGGSVICDEYGWPIAGPVEAYGEGTLVGDCDLDRARDKAWNERNDVLGDRRPDLYRLGETAPVS
jgi:5-aminopentanamidase